MEVALFNPEFPASRDLEKKVATIPDEQTPTKNKNNFFFKKEENKKGEEKKKKTFLP